MNTSELYDKLISELDHSLVVDDKTKEYWMKNYKTLPVPAVEFFLDELVKTDDHVDHMVAVGLDANPAAGEQVIQKTKEMTKKTYKLLEKEETTEENPEDFLKQNLN